MPVTLTLNHLALAVRVTTHLEAPRLPCSDILTRQLAAGDGDCRVYAENAPDDTLNEAVIVLVGHLLEHPPHNRNPQNAFIQSGARGMLGFWSTPRSTRVT